MRLLLYDFSATHDLKNGFGTTKILTDQYLTNTLESLIFDYMAYDGVMTELAVARVSR